MIFEPNSKEWIRFPWRVISTQHWIYLHCNDKSIGAFKDPERVPKISRKLELSMNLIDHCILQSWFKVSPNHNFTSSEFGAALEFQKNASRIRNPEQSIRISGASSGENLCSTPIQTILNTNQQESTKNLERIRQDSFKKKDLITFICYFTFWLRLSTAPLNHPLANGRWISFGNEYTTN